MRKHRFGALGERDFVLFLSAYLLSLTGSAMVPVALSFALFARGDGVGSVSAVLAAETVPMVLLMLAGGVVADRFPPRLVMAASDLLRCVVQALLALLLLTGHAGLPAIMALSALIGVGNAFSMPGRNALTVQTVSPANLQSANALSVMVASIGGLIGPALGGLLVAGVGAAAAIAIDSASYAIGAALLLSIRARDNPDRAPPAGLMIDLVSGWRAFTRERWVWLIVSQTCLLFLLSWGPLSVLGPYGFAHVQDGALRWGGLMSTLGGGMALGAVAAARLTPRRPIQTAQLVFAIYPFLPVSLALHWTWPLQAACFLLSGVGFGIYNVLWETTLQRQIPPEVLSRVSAYDAFGSLCMLPLGYVIAAPMAAMFGVHGTLWFGAGFTALSIATVLALPGIRHAGMALPASVTCVRADLP